MKLKDYLKKHKIHKIAFAKKLGMTRTTIHRYIAEKNIPPLVTKLAIEFITAGEVSRNDW